MPLLIDDQGHALEEDLWQMPPAAAEENPLSDTSGRQLLTLASWQALQHAHPSLLDAHLQAGRIGLWLGAEDDVDSLSGDLSRLALIVVDFPSFTDGRGFSTACLLRQRFGYKGPLRASGDILLDQLFYLRRCGFDQFLLGGEVQGQELAAHFSAFSHVYQGAADQQPPLFRLR